MRWITQSYEKRLCKRCSSILWRVALLQPFYSQFSLASCRSRSPCQWRAKVITDRSFCGISKNRIHLTGSLLERSFGRRHRERASVAIYIPDPLRPDQEHIASDLAAFDRRNGVIANASRLD